MLVARAVSAVSAAGGVPVSRRSSHRSLRLKLFLNLKVNILGHFVADSAAFRHFPILSDTFRHFPILSDTFRQILLFPAFSLQIVADSAFSLQIVADSAFSLQIVADSAFSLQIVAKPAFFLAIFFERFIDPLLYISMGYSNPQNVYWTGGNKALEV
jgi:hypothetical protein